MPDADITELEARHAALIAKLDETDWSVLAKCECIRLIERRLPIPAVLALLSRMHDPARLFRDASIRKLSAQKLVVANLISLQTHPPEPTELGRELLFVKLKERW